MLLQIFFLKHLQHQLEPKVQLAGGSGQKACSLFPVCIHQTIQTHLIWYTSEEQGMKGLSAGTKRLFCMKPAFVLFSENTNYDCKEDRRPSATSCCDYKARNTVMVVITKQFEQFEISNSERSVVITKRAFFFFLHTRTRDVNTESKGCWWKSAKHQFQFSSRVDRKCNIISTIT